MTKALYNGRCLGKVLREINQTFLKHRCLFVQGRRLTKPLSCRNRHRCFRKSQFIFLSTPLSIFHCTRPKTVTPNRGLLHAPKKVDIDQATPPAPPMPVSK